MPRDTDRAALPETANPPTQLGAPDARTEFLWREYGASRDGIGRYDDHLYRIRAWNIALTAILVGAYFGINVEETAGRKTFPGLSLLAIMWLGSLFWLLDGMNKSLQMVHIYNSRYIEHCIRSELHRPSHPVLRARGTYVGPTISLRFAKKERRHFRPTVKNLTDESLWPFYILPMVVAAIVVGFHSRLSSSCKSWLDIECASTDWGLAPIGAAVPLGLLALSRTWKQDLERDQTSIGDLLKMAWRALGSLVRWVWRGLWPVRGPVEQGSEEAEAEARRRRARRRYRWFSKKYEKHLDVEVVRKALHQAGCCKLQDGPQYFSLYKANFYGPEFVVFVDGPVRAADELYKIIRSEFIRAAGMHLFVVTVGEPLFYRSPTGEAIRPTGGSSAVTAAYDCLHATCFQLAVRGAQEGRNGLRDGAGNGSARRGAAPVNPCASGRPEDSPSPSPGSGSPPSTG